MQYKTVIINKNEYKILRELLKRKEMTVKLSEIQNLIEKGLVEARGDKIKINDNIAFMLIKKESRKTFRVIPFIKAV